MYVCLLTITDKNKKRRNKKEKGTKKILKREGEYEENSVNF
jgi:hypothetical protein